MMIGGNTEAVRHLDPIFAALAPGGGQASGRSGPQRTSELGYLHCGPNGAGHFVKMVHNGIESGAMSAHAGGMAVLEAANIAKTAGVGDDETPQPPEPRHP